MSPPLRLSISAGPAVPHTNRPEPSGVVRMLEKERDPRAATTRVMAPVVGSTSTIWLPPVGGVSGAQEMPYFFARIGSPAEGHQRHVARRWTREGKTNREP